MGSHHFSLLFVSRDSCEESHAAPIARPKHRPKATPLLELPIAAPIAAPNAIPSDNPIATPLFSFSLLLSGFAFIIDSPMKKRCSTLRHTNAPSPRNDKSPCCCKGLRQWLRHHAPRCQQPERRGQDSNLRSSYPDTDLANPRFRPLSHLSRKHAPDPKQHRNGLPC